MSRYQSNGFAKLRDKAKLPPTKDSLTLAQALTIGPSLIERFKAKGLISFKAAMPAHYATPHRKKTNENQENQPPPPAPPLH